MSEALGQPGTDDEVFQQLRPELFGLAYRMLAIAADAEDVVQEAYLRWRAQPRDDVRSESRGMGPARSRPVWDVIYLFQRLSLPAPAR